MKALHLVSFALVIIGGLNWGLMGVTNYNAIESLFGFIPNLPQLVYMLVGLSAAYLAVTHTLECKGCKV